MKTCPYCAEEIQEAAVKCRYCGSMLTGPVAERPVGRVHVPGGVFEGTACPRCGSRKQRSGPWPWYLGTIGAMLVKAVVCAQCGHEFDTRKPQADLAARKRNLAIVINGLGLLGIAAIIGSLIAVARTLGM